MPRSGGLPVKGPACDASIAGFTKESELSHHIEHVVARKRGGLDDVSNLALACHRCNLHKGPDLSGIDPLTGRVQMLFHPRRDRWVDHFEFRGAYLEGLTPSGRATVEVLDLNDARRLELWLDGELG
jgi:hypothetical protein